RRSSERQNASVSIRRKRRLIFPTVSLQKGTPISADSKAGLPKIMDGNTKKTGILFGYLLFYISSASSWMMILVLSEWNLQTLDVSLSSLSSELEYSWMEEITSSIFSYRIFSSSVSASLYSVTKLSIMEYSN